MSKRALLALLIAIILPATSYLLVKHYGERDTHMPGRYFFDSIKPVTKNGKLFYDTAWHEVRNISFINQLGRKVSLYDLKGKIVVLDFFFTRCPTTCPALARSMKKLQNSFKINDTSFVQFISISVDPEHDSVTQLRRFADKNNADHGSWWFVAGEKKDIYDFALNEMKASVADVQVDTAFVHTQLFFLLDKEHIIRGWYDGLDSVRQATLVRDIPLLMLEKNRKKTFSEFLKELFGRS